MAAPRFRRRPNRHTLRYRRVNLDHADAAWRMLVAGQEDYLRYAAAIAGKMEVGRNLAPCYRRLWHVLNLIQDVPGTWNPESLSDLGAGMRFDGSSIDDGASGYAEWTEPGDYNDPAEVYLYTHDPDAFVKRVAEVTDGRELDLYVATRYLERGCPPSPYDDSVARFARWSELPSKVWLAQEHALRWGLGEEEAEDAVAHGWRDNKYVYTFRCPSTGEPLPPEPSDEPPEPLLLVQGRDHRRRADHASEASTTSRRVRTVDGTFGVKDLIEAGYTRATAKRRLTAWEAEDLVAKVGYGRYSWRDHALNNDGRGALDWPAGLSAAP